jgi:hypothetical protein
MSAGMQEWQISPAHSCLSDNWKSHCAPWGTLLFLAIAETSRVCLASRPVKMQRTVCELWTENVSHFHPRNSGFGDFEQTQNITVCPALTQQTVAMRMFERLDWIQRCPKKSVAQCSGSIAMVHIGCRVHIQLSCSILCKLSYLTVDSTDARHSCGDEWGFSCVLRYLKT